MTEIVLSGCAPIPLAAYLKALGVFRLVAEQKDENARARWHDEAFVLDTNLTEEELVRFFLDEYRPSPIISPWNGRAGFLEGEDDEDSERSGAELIRLFRATGAPRFAQLRDVIVVLEGLSTLRELNSIRFRRKTLEVRGKLRLVSDELGELNNLKRREKGVKASLICELRSVVPDGVLDWMDACLRISPSDASSTAPLLGSGGNDGSRDLGVNFGKQLERLFDLKDPNGKAKPSAESLLKSAILGTPAFSVSRGAMGQFAPAQAGPNAGVGFGEPAPLNPWNTVLALEGSMLFAGAATRRLGGMEGDVAFPFTVKATGAAGGGSVLSDETEARGEIWVPIWQSFATFAEISVLFSEGRATLGRRPARDGLDFARAAVTLGVNRGISSFYRYGFFKREGRNYLATPLKRIEARENREAALLNDLDRGEWLGRLRRCARSKDVPARLRTIVDRLAEAIFAMTQDASWQSVQRVLISLGETAAYLAVSRKARNPKEGKQNPPPRLSRRWFEAANDGSPEFRIAAALAGLGRGACTDSDAEENEEFGEPDGGEVPHGIDDAEHDAALPAVGQVADGDREIPPPPFCAHLAPLDEGSWYRPYRRWSDTEGLMVWGSGGLDRNLIAVVERRLLFAGKHRLQGSLFEGRAPADLASVLAFLAHETDDTKIAVLAQGLAWAEAPTSVRAQGEQDGGGTPLPVAYAVLKPFFTPTDQLRELGVLPDGAELTIPPGLVARLRSGDIGAALALACRRARASGLPVTFEPGAHSATGLDGPRLLASLVVPLRIADLKHVLRRAYPSLFDDLEVIEPKEGPRNAA